MQNLGHEIGAMLEREVVLAGVAPMAAAGFWSFGEEPHGATGFAGGAGPDSVFDLASITKTCVALTTALAIEAGHFAWTTRIEELLPWLTGTRGGGETIEAHLSHRAGLAAHREFFLPSQAGLCVDRRAILRRAAEAAERAPGTEAVYSDLGYLLVGQALEEHLGQDLDQLVEAFLTAPRGWSIASARQWRARGDAGFAGAVPTEIVPDRGGLVRGEVHDDNAWALCGSATCGHAGLFGTLEGVTALGRSLLDAAKGRGDLAQPASKLLERRSGGSLRLGLDGVTPGSSAGSLVGPNTFGHLGFTGTSFWCDPDSGVVLCLLTNRVRPSRQNLAIRTARPRVHDALFRLARDVPTAT